MAVFPDWSAASILSYNFLTKHLLDTTSVSYAANWLGCLFTPGLAEPGAESPLLLTPPTSNSAPVDPQRLRHLHTINAEKTRLFYKIGVGELCLHSLGTNVGALLIWYPSGSGAKKGAQAPLSVFLPVVQPTEAGLSPTSLLGGLLRALRKVPEITGQEASSAVTAKKLTPLGSKPTSAAGKPMGNSVPAMSKPHIK